MRKRDKRKVSRNAAQKIAWTVRQHRPSENTLDSTNMKVKL